MLDIKARVECLGMNVVLNERNFHFTFPEAQVMQEILSASLLKLGVKLDQSNKLGQVRKFTVIGMVSDILVELQELSCIQGKHGEQILEDFRKALECE